MLKPLKPGSDQSGTVKAARWDVLWQVWWTEHGHTIMKHFPPTSGSGGSSGQGGGTLAWGGLLFFLMRRSLFCRPSSTCPVLSHPAERLCGQTNHVRAARKLPLCSSQLLRSNMISRDGFNCEYRTRTGAIWSRLLSLREPNVPVSNSVGTFIGHTDRAGCSLHATRSPHSSEDRGQRSELICPFRAVAAGGMKQPETGTNIRLRSQQTRPVGDSSRDGRKGTADTSRPRLRPRRSHTKRSVIDTGGAQTAVGFLHPAVGQGQHGGGDEVGGHEEKTMRRTTGAPSYD